MDILKARTKQRRRSDDEDGDDDEDDDDFDDESNRDAKTILQQRFRCEQ